MKLQRLPKGFTLIELLVVISIIALIAGMAVPAIQGAMTKAQLLQAMSNAKQVHLATMTMAVDGVSNSDPMLSWPGDLKVATGDAMISNMSDFVQRLVKYDYLKVGDLKVFACAGIRSYDGTADANGTLSKQFANSNTGFKLYLVREGDSSNTLFLATKNYTYNNGLSATTAPFQDKGFVVFRKGGDAAMLKRQQGLKSDATVEQLIGKMPGAVDGAPGAEAEGGNVFQNAQ